MNAKRKHITTIIEGVFCGEKKNGAKKPKQKNTQKSERDQIQRQSQMEKSAFDEFETFMDECGLWMRSGVFGFHTEFHYQVRGHG